MHGHGEITRIAWETAAEMLGLTLDAAVTGTPSASTFMRGDGSWASAGTTFILENRTSDPVSPSVGQMWLRTDLP